MHRLSVFGGMGYTVPASRGVVSAAFDVYQKTPLAPLDVAEGKHAFTGARFALVIRRGNLAHVQRSQTKTAEVSRMPPNHP